MGPISIVARPPWHTEGSEKRSAGLVCRGWGYTRQDPSGKRMARSGMFNKGAIYEGVGWVSREYKGWYNVLSPVMADLSPSLSLVGSGDDGVVPRTWKERTAL